MHLMEDFGVRAWELCVRVSGFGFMVSGCGLKVWDVEFGVRVAVSRVSCLVCCVSYFAYALHLGR